MIREDEGANSRRKEKQNNYHIDVLAKRMCQICCGTNVLKNSAFCMFSYGIITIIIIWEALVIVLHKNRKLLLKKIKRSPDERDTYTHGSLMDTFRQSQKSFSIRRK